MTKRTHKMIIETRFCNHAGTTVRPVCNERSNLCQPRVEPMSICTRPESARNVRRSSRLKYPVRNIIACGKVIDLRVYHHST